MNTTRTLLFATWAIAATPRLCAAQNDKPKPAADLGLQVLAGGSMQLTGAPSTQRYYKLTYKDQVIGMRGKRAANSDTTHQFLLAAEEADTNSILLDLTHGTGAVNEDKLNALGIDKLRFQPLSAAGLRTAIWVNGTLDGKQANGAFGFETRPWHPVYGRVITNWIIPGINLTQQWKSGDNKTTGQVTYRAFIGYSRWAPTGTEPFTYDDVRAKAATRAVLNENYGINSTRPSSPGPEQMLYDFLFNERTLLPSGDITQAEYETLMAAAYQNAKSTYVYRPSTALWLESVGWYDMVGRDRSRVKTIVALVATIWKDFSQKARSSFQVRYETGFDRATPDSRIHRVIANLGLAF